MRADGEPDADLAGALSDRDQHDVHDADAADQQADARDGAQHAGHGGGGAGHGVGDLGHVADREIVFAVRRDAAGVAQNVLDSRLQFGGRGAVVGGDVDVVDVAVAGDAALIGGKRHQDDIVLVLAEAGIALGFEQADDLARGAVDADDLALGFAGAEELLAHRFADQAHAGAGACFRIRERAARHQLPVAGVEIGAVGAGDARGQALGAENDADLFLRRRRNGARPGQMCDEGGYILVGQRPYRLVEPAWSAAACRAAGTDDEQVRAELGDVRLDLGRGARADGQHGDDGGDTDDDAEQRQERAQHIAADGAQ
ncbi:hypothetical protein X754_19150 [Mesorhizobium sp. LNJC403B00]|nr:hypothetical protein X754_19150 [Mesorhizobium sp. LNJC403B00]